VAFARLVGRESAIQCVAPWEYGAIFSSADYMSWSSGRGRLALVARRHCWSVARVNTARRGRTFLSGGVLAMTYGHGPEQRRDRHRYSRCLHPETPCRIPCWRATAITRKAPAPGRVQEGNAQAPVRFLSETRGQWRGIGRPCISQNRSLPGETEVDGPRQS
jgi:hypothetical protein